MLFYNDIIDLKIFEPNLLKIDKKYKNIDICYIGYITILKIYESIYSKNLLHLRINNTSEYIEEKNGNKYLIFYFVDENKEVLKN